MAVGAQRLAALACERQRRGVHEHDGQLAEQVAAPLEQLLFDDVLDAAGCKLAVGDGSGSWDRTLRLWDLASGESRVLTGHTDRITALAVLPDGRALSGSSDRTMRLWDLKSGESRVFEGHTDTVAALAVLPDGRALSGSRGLERDRLGCGARCSARRVCRRCADDLCRRHAHPLPRRRGRRRRSPAAASAVTLAIDLTISLHKRYLRESEMIRFSRFR